MKINRKLEMYVLKLEKMKQEEKEKMIKTFANLLDTRYPIYEVIDIKEFTKVISDIYNQRKGNIIKIELEDADRDLEVLKKKKGSESKAENKEQEAHQENKNEGVNND